MNGTGLFRELDPPPGGPARLRGALAAAENAHRPRPGALALAAVAGLLVVAWVALRPPAPPAPDVEARAAVEAVLRPPLDGFEPRSARIVERTAAPGGVRFYLLARDGAGSG